MILIPILILIVLMLVGDLLWQGTLGGLHPIVWLAEILGLLAAYHLIVRLIDRIGRDGAK